MKRENGFALLVVLWTLGLLALLVGQFIATGRTEVLIATNMRANAVTQAAADGALHEAILRLLQGTWRPDGRPRVLRVGDVAVEVHVRDQSWKVNPNTATVSVLQSLLVNLAVDASKTAAIAEAIVAWRSPASRASNGPTRTPRAPAAGAVLVAANKWFDSLDEVGLVPGMTPALLARLRPYLSVYQEADMMGSAETNLVGISEQPRLVGDGWHLGNSGRVMLVAVEAMAAGATGGRFTRQAIVRLRAEASVDQEPYQILTWETSSQ